MSVKDIVTARYFVSDSEDDTLDGVIIDLSQIASISLIEDETDYEIVYTNGHTDTWVVEDGRRIRLALKNYIQKLIKLAE